MFISFSALPQEVKDDKVLVLNREMQVAKRSKIYRWMTCPSVCLPSAFDDSRTLPTDEGFQFVKNVDFFSSGGKDATDAGEAAVTTKANTMECYETFANLHPVPDVRVYELGRWTSDVEFGRQILNGVNPVVIQRCESLPDKFPVTEEMVKGSLDRGLTLVQAIEVRSTPFYTSIKI